MKAYMKTFILLLTGVACCATTSVSAETFEVWNSATNQTSTVEIDSNLQILEGYNPQGDIARNAPDERGEFIPASVINGEDWHQVDGNKWPYSAVTHIKAKGKSRCSGAMIGPSTVLTNAHCVYSDIQHESNKKNSGQMFNPYDLTVYAGGDSSPIVARAVRIYAAPGTSRLTWGTEFMKKDYAILVLDQPIGEKSGYFGAKSVNFKKGNAINVIGFPGTKNTKSPWLSPGKVTAVYPNYIYYDADVMGGNSGSPVFLKSDSQNIVAINSFGNDAPNDPYNGATHPSNLLSFINKYRNEQPTEAEKEDSNSYYEENNRQHVEEEIGNIGKRLNPKARSQNPTNEIVKKIQNFKLGM